MTRTIQALLLSRDPGLEAELSAFADEYADEARIVLRVEDDDRRALARVLERRIDLMFVELDDDAASVARLAAEIRRADHPPVLVAVYRPQGLSGDEAFSTRFVDLLRAGVRDFLTRPLSTTELDALIRRELPEGAPAQQSVGRVLSFVGSKGGVGKSTVAVNTAVSLAKGRSVCVVDASLQHGVVADLARVDATSTLADAAREVDRLDPDLLRSLAAVHSSGVHVLAAPANAIDAAAVDEGIMSRIIACARRAYDVVVVDTFPLLDSVTLAILDMSDVAFVVLNDSAPTVKGTAELLGVLDRVGLDRQRCRIVLNRTHRVRGPALSAADVATRLDRTVDHVVPFSNAVLTAANTGKPPAAGVGRIGRWGRAIAGIARDAAGDLGVLEHAESVPEEGVGLATVAEVAPEVDA
ncbi:MAG: AAA family ATPase [Planctomycetota bacterium]